LLLFYLIITGSEREALWMWYRAVGFSNRAKLRRGAEVTRAKSPTEVLCPWVMPSVEEGERSRQH